MISGAHVMIFTRDEDADRSFFRDVLEIPCVDGGGGWLIYKLPPTEMGVHGGEQNDVHHLYFMTDSLDEAIADLAFELRQIRAFAARRRSRAKRLAELQRGCEPIRGLLRQTAHRDVGQRRGHARAHLVRRHGGLVDLFITH